MVFIKKILLQGFKSYKDQTQFDTFDPRTNVICGKNGSGKSNFFDAIRFVLCDERFANLRTPHERQDLLHVGAGDTVMSAYVEVHFDNSDGRFPIDKEEVVLRRSIGLKKDDYFLDSRHLSKAEVTSFLESAGFSRSNPYYIVQQGRIAALATMRDDERLELLKEVAGTKVYDTRRKESEALMTETDNRIVKIDEVMTYIRNRLTELEDEQKELGEFERVDRRRRCLEWALYEREKNDCCDKVKKLDEERATANVKAKELSDAENSKHQEAKEAEKKMKQAGNDASARAKERDAAEEERQERIRRRAKIELESKDAEEKRQREKERAEKTAQELAEVEAQIAEATKKLEDITPKWVTKCKEEEERKAVAARDEARIEELYSKQGRSAQFSSKQERDRWLKRELKSIKETLEQRRQQKAELERDVAQLKAQATHEKEQAEENAAGMDLRRQNIEKGQKEIVDLKAQRDDLMSSKREEQRNAYDLETRAQSIRHEMQKCEKVLESTMSRVLGQGLTAVKRIVQERGIQGVWGPVIENFDVDPELFTAVEVTAGNSLFYVIVDTDETATTILEELNKLRIGRVTFMPLNKLAVPNAEGLPDGDDAHPLLNKIKFPPELKKAFAHIFGKTLLCRTQELAQQLSKTHNCNCITLEGDQVNRKGVWTGGFYDPRSSRLEAMRGIKQWRKEATSNGQQGAKIKDRISSLEQRITQVLGELQKKETHVQQASDTYEQLVADVNQLTKDCRSHEELAEQRERSVAQLSTAVKQMEETEKAMTAEIGTELLSQLNAKEQSELKKLLEERNVLAPQLVELSTQRAELETQRNMLTNTISNNLHKRLEELRERQGHLVITAATEGQESLERELKEAEKAVIEATDRVKEIEKQEEEAQKELRIQRELLERLHKEERISQTEAAEMYRQLEGITNRRTAAIQRKTESEQKIQALGALPSEVLEEGEVSLKLRAASVRELLHELHDNSEKLRSFSHVNKKARDQYISFTDQLGALDKRRKELDEAKTSIVDLIDQLDKKKDEAIERTFKGVSKNFAEVFSELVPGGSATILLKRTATEESQQQANIVPESSEASQSQQSQPSQQSSQTGSGGVSKNRIDLFEGIGVRVRFPGLAESLLMHQLSGGQKSLVALTLIFAIQKTDPAPFYLFDEVDSALDTTYREAVARVIKKQSHDAQFILTTFRPELVEAANKWYGISYSNKVSAIAPITKDEAITIIKEEIGITDHPQPSAAAPARPQDGAEEREAAEQAVPEETKQQEEGQEKEKDKEEKEEEEEEKEPSIKKKKDEDAEPAPDDK